MTKQGAVEADLDRYLFEAAWEVCNKVGGIYTVVTSKLPQCRAEYADRYLAIGPYLPGRSEQEFTAEPLPADLEPVAGTLAGLGITLHYGRWQVATNPPTLLIDWSGLQQSADRYKQRFWEQYQLDTLGTNVYDVDMPLFWAATVGLFTAAFLSTYPEARVALHLHEWLAAGALFTLADPQQSAVRPRAQVVFTTHATTLGRALAERGIFGEAIQGVNDPDGKAREYNVITKHQIEQKAGQLADVFTAVSTTTAAEARQLLGVTPTVVENGIEPEVFPDYTHLAEQHLHARERLLDLVAATFFSVYSFDLRKCVLQFTMGRYEYRNKGYDLYLASLGELNARLKAEGSDRTVISLFLVPGDAAGARPELLAQLAAARETNALLTEQISAQRHAYLASAWQADPATPLPALGLEQPAQAQLQRIQKRLPHLNPPPISAFTLRQVDRDPVLQGARAAGLSNRAEDRVKLIFLPAYFDGADGLFNLPLYDIIVGCDLGVFPSAYEPWGYTPMESLILGIPAVTSTLAGFGQAVQAAEGIDRDGIFLLERTPSNLDQARANLTDFLATSVTSDPYTWTKRRIAAYQSIQRWSWERIYPSYSKFYRA